MVFKLTCLASSIQCWATEWRSVIVTMHVWSSLTRQDPLDSQGNTEIHICLVVWLMYLETVPGSRAPPSTPHRAPCCSSCSQGDECQPGTGSEMASGCGGPGCPHTESPGSGSPHCSFWSTAWGGKQKGIPESLVSGFHSPKFQGILQRTMRSQASVMKKGEI